MKVLNKKVRFEGLTAKKEKIYKTTNEKKGENVPTDPDILNTESRETVIETAHVESTPTAETQANETKINAKEIPPLPPIQDVATMIQRPVGMDPFHIDLDIPGILQYLLAREHDALSKPSFHFTVSKKAACEN